MDMLTDFAGWLKSIIEQIVQFIIDMLFTVMGWIWTGFVALLDTLGLTEQIDNAGHAFDAIPDGVWFFMNMFEMHLGLGLVMAAYGIRFFIRRLPVVG